MNTPVVKGNQTLAGPADRQESAQKSAAAQRKLSRTQYSILSRMAANPSNPLRKLSGGFWIVDPDADEYREGEWHATTTEVAGMLKQGFVQHVSLGSSSVELTAIGIEALRTDKYTPLK